MNSHPHLEAVFASFQVIGISLLLVGPVAGMWFALGSVTWMAIALTPADVSLLAVGFQQKRVPATRRICVRPAHGLITFAPAI